MTKQPQTDTPRCRAEKGRLNDVCTKHAPTERNSVFLPATYRPQSPNPSCAATEQPLAIGREKTKRKENILDGLERRSWSGPIIKASMRNYCGGRKGPEVMCEWMRLLCDVARRGSRASVNHHQFPAPAPVTQKTHPTTGKVRLSIYPHHPRFRTNTHQTPPQEPPLLNSTRAPALIV